jgi:hypothetical protein
MSELVLDRIRTHATRLTLTHLAEEAETLAKRAEADTLGYLEFLDLVLEEEVELREGRRFRNALKLSGLPTARPSTRSSSPSNPISTPARSATSRHSGSYPSGPTSPCSARPEPVITAQSFLRVDRTIQRARIHVDT